MSRDGRWISADEAARLLRVSRATLYAYVSRGFIRSQSTPGPSRERRYAREDVDRARRRTEERRDPGKAAARALQWGVPILESSITLIDGHTLYYRGHEVVTLARTRSIEEVASLIWTGRFDAALSAASTGAIPGAELDAAGLPFVSRAQSALALASVRDPLAFDLRAGGVALTGWRIMHLLTRTAASGRPAPTLDQRLARAWGTGARAVDPIRAALILCADHELNVSAFTARCVASAGSNPYAVVMAGLAALEGTRHGGASARVESMLHSIRIRGAALSGPRRIGTRRAALSGPRSRTALSERLRRGETIDGFGHPLYRNGDPRAAALIGMLRDRYAKSAELESVLEFADAAASLLRERPNVDFALAALARVLRLPPGAPLVLFAIGRTIGWIGHAIEQYATGQLIRPRATYVGIAPPGT
jgi:citrate synthase